MSTSPASPANAAPPAERHPARDGEVSPRQRRHLQVRPSAALALAAQQGDAEAAGELYRRVHGRARRAAGGYCTEADTDDAVAEGLSKALQRIGQLRDPAMVEAWMVRCVVRAAIDLSRQRRRLLPTDAVNDLVDAAARAWDATSEGGMSLLERDAMAGVLRQLQPGPRLLLYLRYDAGLSVRHIASVLGRPAGTVRRQCVEARRAAGQRFLFCQLRPSEGVCASVTNLLCAEPYRRPSARARRQTSGHLRSCRACRERQEELAAIITELGQPVPRRHRSPHHAPQRPVRAATPTDAFESFASA